MGFVVLGAGASVSAASTRVAANATQVKAMIAAQALACARSNSDMMNDDMIFPALTTYKGRRIDREKARVNEKVLYINSLTIPM